MLIMHTAGNWENLVIQVHTGWGAGKILLATGSWWPIKIWPGGPSAIPPNYPFPDGTNGGAYTEITYSGTTMDIRMIVTNRGALGYNVVAQFRAPAGSGSWTDIGTWNTPTTYVFISDTGLLFELEANAGGEVTFDEPTCECVLPVGGFWVPINKTELLAPWIGLASLITVATASVVYVKRRKKKN